MAALPKAAAGCRSPRRAYFRRTSNNAVAMLERSARSCSDVSMAWALRDTFPEKTFLPFQVTVISLSRSSSSSESRSVIVVVFGLDADLLSIASGVDFLSGFGFFRVDGEPVEAGGSGIILQPSDGLGPRIAGMLEHPRNGDSIFEFHPVTAFGIAVEKVLVGARVGFFERIELSCPIGRDGVALVGGVFSSDLKGEGQITQVVWLGLIRVASHHRSSGPAVGHARTNLIDTISTS